MKLRVLRVVFLAVCAASVSLAQTGLATLTGTVTDQSSAVMADVSVQATQVATGTVVTGATSATGNYTITQLRPGVYDVVIEKSGFKTSIREGITLAAAQTLRLDTVMEVGATTESVTVTAEATLLNTDSGALTRNLTPSEIQNLPLLPVGTFVRDPFALGNTLPGVIQNFIATRVNGLGQSSVMYRLDGEVLGQLGFAGITTRTQPSPDAVEEVAVQTTNFNAEFGSVSGAVFNLTIKSGTNQLHGTVYDYAVNEVLNAADPANHERNRVRRHDYGFNIGGPVRIPKIYDGTNKSFFFFNWEQYRDTQFQTTFAIPTVPTAAYRGGDFSGLFAASNNANLRRASGNEYKDPLGNTLALGTVFDPRTTRQVACNTAISSDCGANGTLVNVRSPFPGNKIPTTLFDPVSLAVQNKYVPLPQGPNADAGVLTANYFNPFSTSRITSSPAVKIDQNLGSKGRLSFTYNNNATESPVQALGNLAEGFPEPITGNAGTYESSPAFRINFDYTLTPTMNFHLGLGYSRFKFSNDTLTTDYDAETDIGLRGATLKRNFPRFNIGPETTPQTGGLNSIGVGNQGASPENRPSITPNLTWLRGNHTIKLGAEFRQDMLTTRTFTNSNGNYSFGGNGVTWQSSLLGLQGFAGNTNVGFTYANFLMGSVRGVTLSQPIGYRRSKQQWGTFVQDTWRAARNLTIDYGLRYDYGTYTREDYGRLGNLSLTEPNDSAAGHPGGIIYEATCNCNFAKNYPWAFGPRLGMAYTINEKTVLRGGMSIAYGSTPVVSGAAINSAVVSTPQDGEEAFRLRNGIPSSVQPQWPVYTSGLGQSPGAVVNSPTGLIDPNAGRPDRTYQWNLSLQREITPNLVLEVSYVGNRNIWAPTAGFQNFNTISEQKLAQYGFTVGNLADATLLNQRLSQANPSQLAARGIALPYSNYPAASRTVIQSLTDFPQYANGISPTAPQGKSWYDALQINLTKRYSHGLQLGANYTFSKNLQHTSAFDVFNPVNGKDIVTANPPQVLRISFAYQTPKPSESIPVLGNKVVSLAVRDWQFASALFYQTGTYLGRPASGASNPISRWLTRGPGGAQLKQNADGSYVSPWSVDWTDLDGKHRTDPLDINCHCFDPETTIVLNQSAWERVPDGQWGAQTQQLPFFRNARRPAESFNVARNFRFGQEARYNLQIRVEFQNIFNRKWVPTPLVANQNFLAQNQQKTPDGRYISGFGTFGNLRNPGAFGANFGTSVQRTGLFIARFSF